MVRIAMEETAEGDLPTAVELLEGPEERFPGEVASFAISRPISPMRPCNSASSSLISKTSWAGAEVFP